MAGRGDLTEQPFLGIGDVDRCSRGGRFRQESALLVNLFDDRPQHARGKTAVIYAILITANITAWLWAWISFADEPMLMGTAVLAYMFGLRHAFDADHIAAIDNVVRKLMQDERRPFSVGFFFSLGHSTIVVLASVAIAATAAMAQDKLANFHEVGGTIGTIVSAAFLLAIAIANLFILRSIWRAFSLARSGRPIAKQDLDVLLSSRGFFTRLFRRFFRLVSRSWHMYPIGFLFGLGFDTATEIGLLGISATQAAQGMSFWNILIFPALFTAGMSLVDTTDSTVMVGAYGWAFLHPIRKLWYNLTITAASVMAAVFIGGIEALGLIGEKMGLEGGLWRLVGGLNHNLTNFGFTIVGVFVASWVVSTIIYRAKGYDNALVRQS
jgi:high-affinity nickel-transport protein